MKIERSRRGRALFYHRDSGGKHDQTLPEYVAWAARRATELQLEFDGTPERIVEMADGGVPVSGDLFLDYGISGNTMSRPALNQLRAIIESDLGVSHLFIANRDRLSRPNDPLEAVQLEEGLRGVGLTIVYTYRVLQSLKRGRRHELSDRLTSLFEYDKTGRFREELASKMIHAHARLAKDGYSAGGRAPYGFRRWLVDPKGLPIRQLGHGEVVRLAGHHVCWLPGPDEELEVVVRILNLLQTMAASGIARMLTAEGVPTPDAGRTRKDRGVMTCSSVMYRTPYNGAFRYVCSQYQQSHGQRCSHNHVDGMIASRFALAAVQQQICLPEARKKLEDRLRSRAQAEACSPAADQLLKSKKIELDRIEKNLKQANHNLALAENNGEFQVIREVRNELQLEKSNCQEQIAALAKKEKSRTSAEDEVAALLKSAEKLYQLAEDSTNLPAIGELFQRLNLRMFLRFLPVQKTKRIENKLAGGVLTLGAATPPIDLYSGPTSRSPLKQQPTTLAAPAATNDTKPICSDPEEKSLGNENRDDRI